MKENFDTSVLSAAAQVSTFNGVDILNRFGRGMMLYLEVLSTDLATKTVDCKMQGKIPGTTGYMDLLNSTGGGVAFPQISSSSGVSKNQLLIYPGTGNSGNIVVNSVVPRVWRLVYTMGGNTSQSMNFRVGASHIL
jgi:hypothetical protein